MIASINFLNSSSGAFAKRTGSLSLMIKITDIVVLIKIETKIEYNKIKSTKKYFELCLTV